jgi:hypothetical protein
MTFPLLLASGLLLGQADAGYVRERTSDEDHCLRWPVTAGSSTTISFVQSSAGFSELGAGLFDAVSRAEATWASQANACTSLTLREGSRSASRTVGYVQGEANENLVLVRAADCSQVVGTDDPCWTSHSCGNTHECWEHGPAALAVTLITYQLSGAVLDTDVEINGATTSLTVVDAPPCTFGNIIPPCVGNDVQAIVTHELGHALGLDHSPDPSSTMYAFAALGETSKRILDPASKQFLCDVYPPGLASRDCSPTDGGSPPPGPDGGSPGGGPSPGPGPGGPGITRAASSSCASAGGSGAPGAALAWSLVAAAAWKRRTRR